jgi:hypothetical protein
VEGQNLFPLHLIFSVVALVKGSVQVGRCLVPQGHLGTWVSGTDSVSMDLSGMGKNNLATQYFNHFNSLL